MIGPDVEIDDGCGTILISSEEGETDDIGDKLLKVLTRIRKYVLQNIVVCIFMIFDNDHDHWLINRNSISLMALGSPVTIFIKTTIW